nr:14955_t:CDS:10 [Entrophospora candida]
MIILAIETSCDETSIAILENKKVLSNITISQILEQQKYGGVMPSLAAKLHVNNIQEVLFNALSETKISPQKIDCIAYTEKPGLTLDDAVGECLDKSAVLLGYNYPGGPIIEKLALEGENTYKLSLPKNDKSLDFSFSGLKSEISRPQNSPVILVKTDFNGGELNENKININDVEYHNDANNQIKTLADRSDQKQALLDLEKLLHETLPRKYSSSDLPNFLKGPDVELIDPSSDLGVPSLSSSTSQSREPTGLFAYSEGKKTDIKYLKIVTGAVELCGARKKSDLAILYSKGFKMRKEEFDEFIRQPGFYKGFRVLDRLGSNLKVVLDANDKFVVEKIDPTKIIRYTKKNIDEFRTSGTGYTGNFHDIFTATKTTKDEYNNDVEVFVNSDSRDCLGFQPGDIIFDFVKSRHQYVNGFVDASFYFGGKSKIYYDILCAQNVEEAMDLAFFGKDYNEPQSNIATREANPSSGCIKNPNLNLEFNEISDPTLKGEKYDNSDPNSHPRQEIDNNYHLSKADLNIAKTELEGTELYNLKNRGSELAKKIYGNLEPNKNGFSKEVFAELKKLKAVEIAEQVKNQDSDAENCVKTALESLKNPQENKLEEARQKLKGLLTNLKIGEEEAYQIVVADIKDSETNLNKAIQIFENLEVIKNANNDDNDGSNQGYADEMLKKLTDWAEQRKETHHDIKNAKTKVEFQVAKTKFMKEHEYRNEKPDYDEIYFPLLEKAAEIRGGEY